MSRFGGRESRAGGDVPIFCPVGYNNLKYNSPSSDGVQQVFSTRGLCAVQVSCQVLVTSYVRTDYFTRIRQVMYRGTKYFQYSSKFKI